MTGFDFAKKFNTAEEKTAVLILDALKTACNMAGIDYDAMSTKEKFEAAAALINKALR